MATGPHDRVPDASSEYLIVKRHGVPMRTDKGSIKTMDQAARELLQWIMAIDPELIDAEVRASATQVAQSNTKLRRSVAGLSSTTAIFVALLIVQQLYFKGLIGNFQPSVPAPPPIASAEPAVAPIEPPTIVIPPIVNDHRDALIEALVVLQAEQQAYLTELAVAQAARKKPPTKPEPLLRAEAHLAELRKSSKK